MPVVSIIIPTYNRSHHLRKAIDSALAQSFTDIELIVVDDGSKDDTGELVRNYADARIQYLHQENAGRSAARNAGMEASAGRFISLLDDDDIHFPHKLHHQMAFLAAHPYLDAVASAGYLIGENDDIQGVFSQRTQPIEITLPDNIHQTGIPPSSLLFRRKCLDRMDCWFDPGISYAEDNDFIIRFLLSGHRLVWLPRPLWGYRRYGGRPSYIQYASTLSFHTILERLVARSDLPSSILDKKDKILSGSHMVVAQFAFLHRISKLGQYHLKMAVALDPSLLESSPPQLIRGLSKFVRDLPTDEQEPYIQYLNSHLPESLLHLRPFLHEALR